jgi:hypothetical protein
MRKFLVLLAMGVAAAGLLTTTGSATTTGHASACSPMANAATKATALGTSHFAGIVRAQGQASLCGVHNEGDFANGEPPLLWHGGPMMGTTSTGPLNVIPIFWNPTGHPMTSAYKNKISTYLAAVAADSGTNTNVWSTLTEYSGTNGFINYDVQVPFAVQDRGPLPASGCDVASNDTSEIYADGSGYDSCLDDAQVIAETERVVNALGLPRDLSHQYILYLPKHVETCFDAGSTVGTNACTINHQTSAAYCAYHSMNTDGMVYANLSYPIYRSPTGFTCGSDARFPTVESPNGNKDADTEISPTSHEIMEAATDSDVSTGWYDIAGFENGDECAYVYGSVQGNPGKFYNQTIAGIHFMTQEGFSNTDFFDTGGGCVQGENQVG